MTTTTNGSCGHRNLGEHTRLLSIVVLMTIVVTACMSRMQPPASVRADLNLLVITLDTTRADRIGAYRGSHAAATPHFDRLAREGVLFEDATSPSPLTLPAHCTLFTGWLPPRHGVRENVGRLDASTPTLATLLRARGYRTAAFVAAEVLARSRGLYLGFDVYDDKVPSRNAPNVLPRSKADAVVTRAIRWIGAGRHASPFFAWLHVYDAHVPYEAPSAIAQAYPGRPYEAAIASIDVQIGRLLAFLNQTGLINRTLLVVIGDHGEALGDHGEATHGLFVYQSVLHVPFVLRAPDAGLRGRRVKTAVSTADLMPTVLDLLGADLPDGVDGRSLVRMMARSSREEAGDIYSENLYVRRRFGWSEMRVIRSGAFKLIDKTRPELYDLERDPGETRDLSTERPALVARLTRRLRAWHARLEPAEMRAEVPDSVSPEVRRQMASLGYIGAVPRDADDAQAGADPRDHVEFFNCLSTPASPIHLRRVRSRCESKTTP